jgi:hypothetical protein
VYSRFSDPTNSARALSIGFRGSAAHCWAMRVCARTSPFSGSSPAAICCRTSSRIAAAQSSSVPAWAVRALARRPANATTPRKLRRSLRRRLTE